MKFNVRMNVLSIGAAALVLANRAVTLTSSGLCRHAEPGEVVIGISGPYDTPANDNVDVAQSGVLPVVFETAVAAGSPVGLSSAGRLQTVNASEAIGIAAESVSAGEVGSVRPKF